jgi:MraZ protein
LAFRGHFEHSLDSKDRLTVPSGFRAALADGVVLVAGLDPSVWVFPPAGYEQFVDRFLAQINPLSPRGQMLRRHFYGNSYDAQLDSAGRIRLPKHLIEHAGLSGDCVVRGNLEYFELMDAARWSKYGAEMRETVPEAAEKLAEEG